MTKLLKGWDEIAEYLRVSKSTARRRRLEFLKNNIIFYQYSGRPPQCFVCAFKDTLSRYVEGKKWI